LHASTQCDLRTPDKARFLEALGFSQLVMARELTFNEIADIRQAVRVPLEAFIHGALCVCYSGRCQMSQAIKKRSANRGECAQMCRLPYDLVDEQGRVLVSHKHLLSLRDMNRTTLLRQMIDAGVSSFKIEGRLKDINYVKNVVAHYRKALDEVIAQSDGQLRRASFGAAELAFDPDVRRSFNRNFTTYFIDCRKPDNGTQMASIDTPKSLGQYVGKVSRARGKELVVETQLRLVNGDGLSYFSADGQFTGIRVNVASGNHVSLRESVPIPRGTDLYRTSDKAMDDILSRSTAMRRIAVEAKLRRVGERLVLTLVDERGCGVTHAIDDVDLQPAKSSQEQRQLDVLAKLGDTIYTLREAQVLPDCFIPASTLTRLRRETVDLLDRTWHMSRHRDRRRPEDMAAPCYTDTLTSADNVANQLAYRLYRDHGVSSIEPALECQMDKGQATDGIEVMYTRYCLRRELGACLKTKDAKKLPARIFLRTGNQLISVHCDCTHCEMHLSL
jgi:putative protease